MCNYFLYEVKMNQQPIFQILSDLHIDKYSYPHRKNVYELFKRICVPPSIINKHRTILIIAGDVCSIVEHSQLWKSFMNFCSNEWSTVWYIFGNHEYYNTKGITIDQINSFAKQQLLEIGAYNIKILHNQFIVSHAYKFCLWGSTLWSNLPDLPIYSSSREILPVYVTKQNTISRKEYNELYQTSLSSLYNCIRWMKVNIPDYKLIVVSHHAPMMNHFRKEHQNSDRRFMYGSNLNHLLLNRYDISSWIFGHTHVNLDVYLNNKGTRCISNCYPLLHSYNNNKRCELREL